MPETAAKVSEILSLICIWALYLLAKTGEINI